MRSAKRKIIIKKIIQFITFLYRSLNGKYKCIVLNRIIALLAIKLVPILKKKGKIII